MADLRQKDIFADNTALVADLEEKYACETKWRAVRGSGLLQALYLKLLIKAQHYY